MPIRYESYAKEEDQARILNDIVVTTLTKGFPAFISKDQKFLLIAYPLENQSTKTIFGEAYILNKLNDEITNLEIQDVDLVIKNRAKEIHLSDRLIASSDANEHYIAEYDSAEFVIETVNRHAIWEDNLENKDYKVGLSAFAFQIGVYDNIEAYNSQYDFNGGDFAGRIVGFSEKFVMPKDEESDTPYTYFLGTVVDVKDVKVKLTEVILDFSIILVDSFLGKLPVVASKKIFNLRNLEKGKLLAVSADIKAYFGVDPTEKAIFDQKS